MVREQCSRSEKPLKAFQLEGAIMSESSNKSSVQTDVAALASGVVAVAVAMFVEDGAFHPLGLIVSITLVVLILSYVGKNERNVPQRIALGAVMGILAIPVFGVFMEHCPWFWMNNAPRLLWLECPSDGQNPSRIHSAWLLAIWLVIGVAAAWLDYRYQKRAFSSET